MIIFETFRVNHLQHESVLFELIYFQASLPPPYWQFLVDQDIKPLYIAAQ